MIIHVCDIHTLADVVKVWRGMEPHVVVPTTAAVRPDLTCDACNVPSTRNIRVKFI